MNSTALNDRFGPGIGPDGRAIRVYYRPGKCELCGEHTLKLRMLICGDFAGWACEKCTDVLGRGIQRRYIPPTEETEPCE